MGTGIFLIVLGAILAFAVHTDASWIDLQVVGVILILAGAAVIAHARRGRRERVVTRVSDAADPDQHTHSVEETVTERDTR